MKSISFIRFCFIVLFACSFPSWAIESDQDDSPARFVLDGTKIKLLKPLTFPPNNKDHQETMVLQSEDVQLSETGTRGQCRLTVVSPPWTQIVIAEGTILDLHWEGFRIDLNKEHAPPHSNLLFMRCQWEHKFDNIEGSITYTEGELSVDDLEKILPVTVIEPEKSEVKEMRIH